MRITGYALAAVLGLSLVSCKKEEAGFSGGNDSGNPPPNSGTPPAASNEDPKLPDTPVIGTGGTLKLLPISDKAVNSGETSRNYSETLHVPMQIEGGEGTISFSAKSNSNSPNISVTGGTLAWRPGSGSGSSYKNEVGSHTVTVTATDTAGQSSTQSFKVDVRPLKWTATSRDEGDDTNMTTDFHITEELHPNRLYQQEGTLSGKDLNTATCTSFDGSKTITLEAAPAIVNEGKTSSGSVNDNHLTLTYKYHKDKQTTDRMVFVTWLNFKPNPTDSISSSVPAKTMLIYFAYARCLNGDDPEACKKNAIGDGMGIYYLCSDYEPSNMKKKDMYCNMARNYGMNPSGC